MNDPVRLAAPRPVRDERGAVGEVVALDRFGNAATNLPGSWAEGGVVELEGVRVHLARTYGDVARGEILAVVDSDGMIEIAVRGGSAAERLGITAGAPVRLPAAR